MSGRTRKSHPPIHAPGGLSAEAPDRTARFTAALAEYANLPADDEYLPALAVMVEMLILPALNVLNHGFGHIDIEVAQNWPLFVDHGRRDRAPPRPPRKTA